jgi:predicted acetyltransferase
MHPTNLHFPHEAERLIPVKKTAMLCPMALQMRWVGNDELDRVAETRWKCYGHAHKDLAKHKEIVRTSPWPRPGDYLLAEKDGEAVGTASEYPMTMWVRGSAVSCQGVAYVGTIKSARRRGGKDPGVASAVMKEMLRVARERQYVVTALMPFRASFYEHFGYGIVERRADWTIPLSVLPRTDWGAWRFIRPEDRDAHAEQWQRSVQAGQCDIERSTARWKHRELYYEEEGMMFIDREAGSGPARGSAFVTQEITAGRNILKIQQWSVDSPDGFLSMLSFFGTMKDQFSTLLIGAPADWQINRLLVESQIPHRPVEHPTATASIQTRMQLRILDHRKYLESLHWPEQIKGRAVVSVAECEGSLSQFAVEVDSGLAKVTDGGEPDFECADRNWASIATGDLPVDEAIRLAAAKLNNPRALEVLRGLAIGPIPCCRESF